MGKTFLAQMTNVCT